MSYRMNTSLKATPSRAPKHIRALALSATVGLAMAGASLPAAAAPTADIGGTLLEGEEPIANALVTAYTLDGESPEFEAEAQRMRRGSGNCATSRTAITRWSSPLITPLRSTRSGKLSQGPRTSPTNP